MPYEAQILANSVDSAKPLKTSSLDTPDSRWFIHATNPAPSGSLPINVR